jgi:hypothetical protein
MATRFRTAASRAGSGSRISSRRQLRAVCPRTPAPSARSISASPTSRTNAALAATSSGSVPQRARKPRRGQHGLPERHRADLRQIVVAGGAHVPEACGSEHERGQVDPWELAAQLRCGEAGEPPGAREIGERRAVPRGRMGVAQQQAVLRRLLDVVREESEQVRPAVHGLPVRWLHLLCAVALPQHAPQVARDQRDLVLPRANHEVVMIVDETERPQPRAERANRGADRSQALRRLREEPHPALGRYRHVPRVHASSAKPGTPASRGAPPKRRSVAPNFPPTTLRSLPVGISERGGPMSAQALGFTDLGPDRRPFPAGFGQMSADPALPTGTCRPIPRSTDTGADTSPPVPPVRVTSVRAGAVGMG